MQEKPKTMDITKELSEIQKMSNRPMTLKKKIDRIFAALRGYGEIKNPESHEEINCISIAINLSRLTCAGLSRRTNEFLDIYERTLPEKAVEILRDAFKVKVHS